MYSPPFFCSLPVRPVVQHAGTYLCAARRVVQPAGTYLFAARRYVFMCSPLARPIVQPAGTYLCAARWPALLYSPPVRIYVQTAVLCSHGRSQDFSKGGAEVMEAKALKRKNCL